MNAGVVTPERVARLFLMVCLVLSMSRLPSTDLLAPHREA